MKNMRFLAFLTALLCLLSITACKRDKQPENGNEAGKDQPSYDTNIGDGQDDDASLEADRFFAEHGYPQGFALHFSADGRGFDTAAGEAFDGDDTREHDFTAQLQGLYYDLSECNLTGLPLDLTYEKLSEGRIPPVEIVRYTITFTLDGQQHEIRTDSEAIEKFSENANVSNVRSIVRILNRLTDQCLQ